MFNIGIHIDGPVSKNTIDLVTKYFKSLNSFTGIHIFTDEDIVTHMDMAYLSCFYMSFYTESILFLNLENFLSNQHTIISNSVYLLTSKEELDSNYVTKKSFKDIRLLTIKNGEIYEI